MTTEQAGELIGRTGTTVSRMESGKIEVIRPPDVLMLCKGYGASSEETAYLVELATQKRSVRWWDEYGGTPKWFQNYLALEGEASELGMWHPTLIPGLLQTEDYAREVMVRGLVIRDPKEIERQVKIRMARQSILDRPDPPQLWVVLDEGVVTRVLGGRDVMRQQLEHLVAATERPNVTVQLLPYGAGGHAALIGGPIVLVGFPDKTDPGVVYLENHTGVMYLEEDNEIVRYTAILNHLRAAALAEQESRDRIAAIAATM